MSRFIGAALIGALAFSGLFTAMAQSAEAGPRHRGHAYSGAHYGDGYHYRGGRHYRGHRPYRHHRRHGHVSGGDVLLGVGAGLLLYSIIDSASSRRADVYDRGNYYAGTAPQQIYTYAEPPRYVARPGPIPARDAYRDETAINCLQTREYQTTITVAGEEKDAYGTACLQPDGSWMMGEAKLVPQFD